MVSHNARLAPRLVRGCFQRFSIRKGAIRSLYRDCAFDECGLFCGKNHDYAVSNVCISETSTEFSAISRS